MSDVSGMGVDSVRFSDSLIWSMQRQYYDNVGIDAWADQVPFYITSNPLIAAQYAKIVLSFCLDCLKHNPDWVGETFYLVELGTGTGQFSYYVLKYLTEYQKKWGAEHVQICYIMTDFTSNNVSYWKKHQALEPYVSSGMLDFALFDLEKDEFIKLENRGVTLVDNSVVTPLIVFGNYLFDSVLIDVFNVSNQAILETRVSVRAKDDTAVVNSTDADIKDIKLVYENKDIAKNYYQHAVIDAVLNNYVTDLDDTYLHFPIAGLKCLDALSKLSSGKLLLLSSDKGYVSTEELNDIDPPELDVHGSFSLMVNYHAIAEYFRVQGGWARMQEPFDSFATGVFCMGIDTKDLPTMTRSVDDMLDHYCPGHYYHLFDHFEDTVATSGLESIASMMALSHWDPAILDTASDRLSDLVDDADQDVLDYLNRNMKKMADNFYYVPGVSDSLFSIAVYYQEVGFYKEAIKLYLRSAEYFEESYELYFNLGYCHLEAGEPKQALDYFYKAREFNTHSKELVGYIRDCQQSLTLQ